MKHLFAILLLTVISLQSFGQRTNDLKLGLGLPIFLGNETGLTNYSKINGLPAFSIEKPIAFKIQRDEKICLNPGLAFFYFNETEGLGTEIANSSKDLSHLSFNGYLKLLYKQTIQRRSEAFIYIGGITGVHFYSHTSGEKTIYSQNSDNPYFEEVVDENGKDFFNTIYYGAVAGFQPNAKITNRYKASFELSFYPNFVSRQTGEKASAVQLSILLGINM